jgi:hypothetical protein
VPILYGDLAIVFAPVASRPWLSITVRCPGCPVLRGPYAGRPGSHVHEWCAGDWMPRHRYKRCGPGSPWKWGYYIAPRETERNLLVAAEFLKLQELRDELRSKRGARS